MRKRDYLTDPKYDVATISPREGVRENEDGTVSTYKIVYSEGDGIFYVYPTLFQNKDGSWVEKDDRDNWGALKEAINRGEIYDFDSERMAKWSSFFVYTDSNFQMPKDFYYDNNYLFDYL